MSSAETEQEPIEVTATAVDRPKFPAVVFNIALAEVAKLGEQFRGLTATDNKSYEIVKRARATMRSGRTELDRRRKALKADAVAYGKLVDSNAKQIGEAILEVENPLANESERYETERDAARLAAEEAERQKIEAEIRAKQEAEEAERQRIIKEQEAQLEAQRAELAAARKQIDEARNAEAERQRLAREAEEAKQRAEREQLEKERAELQSIRDKLDADRKAAEEAEARRQEAARLEQEAKDRAAREEVEAARRKLEEERNRLEQEEADRQRKIQEEAEAKQRAEREAAEAEQRRKDEEARAEAERLEAAKRKSDAEKVVEFGVALSLLLEQSPAVKSKAAKVFLAEIEEEIKAVALRCSSFGSK